MTLSYDDDLLDNELVLHSPPISGYLSLCSLAVEDTHMAFLAALSAQ